MSIHISSRAAERLKKIKEKHHNSSILLRIEVVHGGCSGLTYKLSYDDIEQNQDRDKVFTEKGISLVVDMRSYFYLAGTELDYSDGLEGKGFHFHNPNANRTCACGTSFST